MIYAISESVLVSVVTPRVEGGIRADFLLSGPVAGSPLKCKRTWRGDASLSRSDSRLLRGLGREGIAKDSKGQA